MWTSLGVHSAYHTYHPLDIVLLPPVGLHISSTNMQQRPKFSSP